MPIPIYLVTSVPENPGEAARILVDPICGSALLPHETRRSKVLSESSHRSFPERILERQLGFWIVPIEDRVVFPTTPRGRRWFLGPPTGVLRRESWRGSSDPSTSHLRFGSSSPRDREVEDAFWVLPQKFSRENPGEAARILADFTRRSRRLPYVTRRPKVLPESSYRKSPGKFQETSKAAVSLER